MSPKSRHIQTDVLIIGGGAAGIAAAHSASLSGAHVTLIEKHGFLGGMATAAYVGTICGMYYRSEGEEVRPVTEGFSRRFVKQLADRSESIPIKGQMGLRFLPYDRQAFMALSDDLLTAAHVNILYHATLHSVVSENKQIQSVLINTENGIITIQPTCVIDTSGHAAVGHLVDSIHLIESKNYQAGAFVFGLSHLKVDMEMQLNLHIIKTLKAGIDVGFLENDKSWISLIPGSLKNGAAFFKLSIPFQLHDGPQSISTAEMYSRKKLMDYVDYFKKSGPVFKDAEISMTAPAIGVRTGPRYQGKYMLTADDVLTCRKFEKSAARGCWPIEYWQPGERVEMTFFDFDDYYDIPQDCLVCHEIENLIFAGRHISASEQAIASARVIGTCLQMGETSGKMAIEIIRQG